MQLYLVTTENFDYDEYSGFVIRAASHEEAKKLAEKVAHNQKSKWTSKLIKVEGKSEVILDSFHAG